mmetsp:Transcript_37185/g.78330  ORF Transcript_37185/g.78330 Transcript_37185/m.78330 type:complete len:214 (-) Transcript_37185:1934-2575(-)
MFPLFPALLLKLCAELELLPLALADSSGSAVVRTAAPQRKLVRLFSRAVCIGAALAASSSLQASVDGLSRPTERWSMRMSSTRFTSRSKSISPISPRLAVLNCCNSSNRCICLRSVSSYDTISADSLSCGCLTNLCENHTSVPSLRSSGYSIGRGESEAVPPFEVAHERMSAATRAFSSRSSSTPMNLAALTSPRTARRCQPKAVLSDGETYV